MKIYYQGVPGAYSHLASMRAQTMLPTLADEILACDDFDTVREHIQEGDLGVVPIENSYAGSIHANFYHFLRYQAKILGEIALPIDHCLLSRESDIKKITKAYSHQQALSQCHDFLKAHGIHAIPAGDTAGSAQMLATTHEVGAAAIASKLAGELYGLNILAEAIQDQKGNTTRFFVVANHTTTLPSISSVGKMSLMFEVRDVPGALYKCLGAFATNNINILKIESLPSYSTPFSYCFWVDLQGSRDDQGMKHALDELAFFTSQIEILGQY